MKHEKLRVLVIDDDEAVCRVAAIILSSAGFDVDTAHDGDAGLRLFRSISPHLVIIDILMPDKEGIETILDIRRERADAKIIAMSGGGAFLNQRTVLKIASDLCSLDILHKPFDGTQLRAAVKRVLGSVDC